MEPVSHAIASVPDIGALYVEDIYDAFEYLDISYLESPSAWRHWDAIHTTDAILMGNRIQFCKTESPLTCDWFMAVSYTDKALRTSIGRVPYPVQEFPRKEHFDLGYDALHQESDEASYWMRVRSVIRFNLAYYHGYSNITHLLLSGDAAHIPEFRQILQEEMDSHFDIQPTVIDDHLIYGASRGLSKWALETMLAGESGRSFEVEDEL
jgi:hypothetical protein